LEIPCAALNLLLALGLWTTMHSEPTPLVTVVTPSYNQGRFIRATIESVLSQNYPHIEYIVMDGGSTDETAAVVKDYASRLRFISEKDRGQSHAINKGFQMAAGTVLAWLNSDDLFLPGAVGAAVRAFAGNGRAGAVYGEGYLIDKGGNVSGRFPCTEPMNLWRLIHISDYILQQTVYFRKAVLDDVGYLDEDLHYVMDWDILIRIGKKYPLEYVPEYMGCLREYAEAKSFAGGPRRIRELRDMLRRHTGMRIPPGYLVYGLDTYRQIWCREIEARTPRALRPVSRKFQCLVSACAGHLIARAIREPQGLYPDGWASRRFRYMLPPGQGPLMIEGTLPDWGGAFDGQTLTVECAGKVLGRLPVPLGEFRLELETPSDLQGRLLDLTVTASRFVVPEQYALRGDHRRLAFRFKALGWSEARQAAGEDALSAAISG
jgi:hypothetical protein